MPTAVNKMQDLAVSAPNKDERFFFQPKLIIGQHNDPDDYRNEQEADAMADKVMQETPSEKKFFPPAAIQRQCAECEEEEKEKKLQKKQINSTDVIIQRQHNNEPKSNNNNFQLPPFRPQLAPPLIPPLHLNPPFDSIGYLGLRETFFNRGVLFPGNYMGGAQQEWARQYLFYKQFGLGNAVGNSFIGDSLRFFGVTPPGGDWNAWLSNTTTPLAVDSALSRDFPNFNEQEERRGGLPAPVIFHLPEVHFKKAGNDSSADVTGATENYLSSLSGGEPLSKQEKNFFEPRIDSDFSEVRIHNDNAANESAKSLNALAYTQGNDIVFGSNQYQPDTDEGKKLMAHELTHVIQQNGSVQRKPAAATALVEEDLKTQLQAGNYSTAYLALNDFLDWNGLEVKRRWLADHAEIRYLFLKSLPATITAEIYSASELISKPVAEAYALINCWYQTEDDKQLLYVQNLQLFDHLVETISPYTGERVVDVVTRLTSAIPSKSYPNYAANAEFHTINLLAPTIDRKIKLYHQYEGLFKVVSKKFDPFTGTSKEVFEYLTDTNEVSKERAIGIYETLKKLPEEQRNAFLESAAFAGMLEADKDAEKYYSKNYKAQYKALPHNWDSAIMPWNWGSWDAPFAERLTIDHVALMSAKLTYEYKATRKFGFDTGIDSGKNVAAGQDKSDAEKFMQQLQDDSIFTSSSRLYLLLAIGVRGGLEKQITEKVLRPKSSEGKITPQLLAVIESYGFLSNDQFNYHADKAVNVDHDVWQNGYIYSQTMGGGKSGKVFGEQRGTFDLLKLQDTSENLGSLGGMKFSSGTLKGGEKYYNAWLDQQVKSHEGSGTLLPNLEQTKGSARQNKIFASIRNDVKQANIYASNLLVEGLNYFKAGTLYRSGPGILQGLAIHLSWTKDTSDPDNDIYLSLGIENILLNNFQLILPKSTMAIGQIVMKGMNLSFTQNKLPAAKGLFLGLLKNVDFTLNALMALLPNVLVLLPNSILTMTEEFKGAKAHIYKDKLAAILQSDFSSLQSTLTFTSVQVKNIYDTTAGFFDDISIEKRDDQGKLIEQKITMKETYLWTADASRNIKERIKVIDEKVLAEKAELINTIIDIDDKDNRDLDKQIIALETEKKQLIDIVSAKALKYENRDAETERLRIIYSTLGKLRSTLDTLFAKAIVNNPLYSPLNFKVLQTEKDALQKDLDYLDNKYYDDKQIAESDKSSIKRYEARQRKAEFEAKYKSVDVAINFQGISIKGGSYLRDILTEKLKAFGFEDPVITGLENIEVGAVDAAFISSGKGTVNQRGKPGVLARDIKIPLITAPKLAYKTEGMLIEAGSPVLTNVIASATINFAKNPLDKGVGNSYKWELSDLKVATANFKGITLKVGKAEPLLDFPASTPVEVWGLHVWNYDPETNNINLSINDVKAQGAYADTDEAAKTSKKITFGIDTVQGHKPGENEKPAIEINYDNKEQSIITKVNIASAWIPSIDIQSPTLSISSMAPDANAVELKNIQADVKILLEKYPVPGADKSRPMSFEINKIHLDEINAQGIKLIMREVPEEIADAKAKAKPAKQTVQEVTLPKNDKVSIKDINISGLRVTLAEEGPTLSTINNDASISVNKTDLSGISYNEKTAKGSLLKAIAIHSGKFDALTLDALGRNGREYSLKEFFKFFGRTRLEGLDASGSYTDGKTSATVGLTGKKNIPIGIDYTETKDDKPGYYDMRLPLSRVNVPALHIEKDEHTIIIPKPADKTAISYLEDVDAKLRAYVEFDADNKVHYDIYLMSLDIATFNVFGLEYHNKEKGIDVVFEKLKALKIPNVKAGGFHFSSAKGFDVFGKAGGWLTAGSAEESITASFDQINARLTDGGFLAEKDGGRSALDLDIASLGFKQDAAGNMEIMLGAIHGGFPKMTITQTDTKSGAVTKTTIGSTDNKAVTATGVTVKLGADKNNVIDALGLTAGGIKIESVETKGKEKSTTTVNLAANALGADSATVKLNADKSKEITLKGIKGGQISADLISEGGKDGKSVKNITLPDPKLIDVEAVIIKIDPDDHKKITIQKPTIRNFKLRMPNQKIAGDYTSILCDLKINGDVDLGDGNFKDMIFASPYDAFVFAVQDDVPVEISNLRFEYKDTSTTPDKTELPKPLTADQQELLRLEEIKIAAKDKLDNTSQTIGSKKEPMPNPEWDKARDAFMVANKAYEAQKDKIITAAKTDAKASMTKKYLDAVEGTAEVKMVIYNSTFTLNVETYKGDKYVEISQKLVTDLKPVIRSIIGSTVSASFWNSKEIIALAKNLQHWYVTLAAPSIRGYIDAMANGNGIGSVLVVFDDADLFPSTDPKDSSMFGINININSSWIANLLDYDIIQVMPLCESGYKHPLKGDFYNLYGIIEYLQFVKPSLVSVSARQEAETLKKVLSGAQKIEDLGLKDTGTTLLNYLIYSFEQEMKNIRQSILENIHGVGVTADVTLKPDQVINELLREKKAGSLIFDKGKKSIDDVHVDGVYVNDNGKKQTIGSVGGGEEGKDNVVIPGATYTSEDKGTKVSYKEIDFTTAYISYEDDVLKAMNKNISIKGLKGAILRK